MAGMTSEQQDEYSSELVGVRDGRNKYGSAPPTSEKAGVATEVGGGGDREELVIGWDCTEEEEGGSTAGGAVRQVGFGDEGCRREGCGGREAIGGGVQSVRISAGWKFDGGAKINSYGVLAFREETWWGKYAKLISQRREYFGYCGFAGSFLEERASSVALKSNKSLKTEKDKPPPPLPGPEFWFRAPYLGSGDKLWHLVEADADIGKVVDKPLLGYKEVSVEEGCFISPKSVLRFQVERGEFPHCLSAYRNYVVPPTAFATWADDILGNADFVELLRKADVHRAVVNSLRLVILRERKWMDVVVSRWSTDSHTLQVAWGETGPTLEDAGCLLRLPMLGKVDPSSGRLSPSQQGVVYALRRSVRREKGHNGVKNTFTKWARYWYEDLGASKAGEEAHVVTDGPGLKEPAHLAAFLAYWLTWYIFPGPPKDGVDTTLFELAAIPASEESIPLAPLFLGTLFKRLDMLHDAARRSCGRYDLPIYVATNFLHMFLFEQFPRVAPEPNDFGVDDGGGKGEPCRNVCQSARWSGSGVRDVRGGIADVIDIEGEFVARPYVNTPKGVFPFNVYSEEDVVAFANKDDASTAELFRMSCMMRGELPYFVNGKYGTVTYDPMRVARQFGFDQGVPKPLLPLGVVGDVWRRFLKSAFPAELRPMNTITLPGAKRMGGCTKLYRKYWRDNVVRFLEYVKGVLAVLEVEDVMSQDGELCLPKVKDPALALFGACSPYVKEEVLGRVREYLKNTYGILAKDVGSSVSLSDRDGEGQAEGTSKEIRRALKRFNPVLWRRRYFRSTCGGTRRYGRYLGDEGVSSGGVSHPWKGKSLHHMRSSNVVQSDEEEEDEMEWEALAKPRMVDGMVNKPPIRLGLRLPRRGG
ncbi:hypothetical protein C3L33_15575, partial [Rhododendron williamsianum]